MRRPLFDRCSCPHPRGFRALLLAVAIVFAGALSASAAPRTVSAGDGLTCAVGTDAGVRCDQMIDLNGRDFDDSAPHALRSFHDATAVATGQGSTCVLRGGGRVSCVGEPYAKYWELEGVWVDFSLEVSDVPIGAAADLDADDHHTCAALKTGAVSCWGTDDSHGELGDGTTRGVYPHQQPDQDRGGSPQWIWWNSWEPVRVTGLADAVDIGLGGSHSCAVRKAGTVVCWGAGASGQLGNGGATSSDHPVAVSGLSSATRVDGGDAHTCALRKDGHVLCWGSNSHGQLGDGTHADHRTPTLVVGINDAVAISAGGDSSCAVRRGGQVICWGRGNDGQIGDGSMADRTQPTVVDGLAGMTAVTVGRGEACAAGDGPVRCWGRGYSSTVANQRGTGRYLSEIPAVTKVAGLNAVATVASGGHKSCAVEQGGALSCWGQWPEPSGALVDHPRPVAIRGLGAVRDVAIDEQDGHLACAISGADGDAVRCFDALSADGTPALAGGNSGGSLITGSQGARSLAIDPNRGCAAYAGDAKRCWDVRIDTHPLTFGDSRAPTGDESGFPVAHDHADQCYVVDASPDCARIATWNTEYTPEWWRYYPMHEIHGIDSIEGPSALFGLDGATQHWCMHTLDGHARCFGAGPHGELGDGTGPEGGHSVIVGRPVVADLVDRIADGSDPGTPTLVSPPRIIGNPGSAEGLCGEGIWSHADHVTQPDGEIAIELAEADLHCRSTATNAAGEASWATQRKVERAGALPIAAGGRHTCALRAGGGARCWGSGDHGRLGSGAKGDRTWPSKVSGLSGAVQISAGDRHSCAVMDDGSVRCWGFNLYGQLGDGTTTNAYKPVLVNGLTDAVQVAVGARHTCAVRRNGRVACWGLGARGRLGDGSSDSSTKPVAVSGIDSAFTISAGAASTCAIDAKHSVWCWGAGVDGQLGDGLRKNALEPVVVSGILNAFQVTVGDGFACAVRTGTARLERNGDRWFTGGPRSISCWGSGAQGQLGDGHGTASAIPVDVVGLNGPVQVAAGASHACAVVDGGHVQCWGSGARGQLGDGAEDGTDTPVDVLDLDRALSVTAGGQHTCATRVDAAPVCWGRGLDGELGQDDRENASKPVEVAGGAKQVAH